MTNTMNAAAKLTARLARTESLRNERAALRVRLGSELGLSPFCNEVRLAANAMLRRAGKLA